MKEALSIAAQSIASEKQKHLANAAATGTAGTIGATGTLVGDIVGWLPTIGVILGIGVSCALFYKTYLEIKLAKVQLAKEGRRQSDH